MIDLDRVRKNPELFQRAIDLKRIPLNLQEFLQIVEARRELIEHVNKLRERRNQLTEEVAGSTGAEREKMIDEARCHGRNLATKEAELGHLNKRFDELQALLPSLPAANVPAGKTDEDNVELRKWAEPKPRPGWFRDHIELAQMHGMLDFEGARLAAGSRAYALLGDGVLLEMAVMRFALDHLIERNFIPVTPPLLVRHEAMFGTGYFPLGLEDAYEIERDKLYIAGTSEVGVVAMHANAMFELRELPLKFAGISTCFRREAGAAGRDTRGLYRVHQFQKVEQVIICENDEQLSEQLHFQLLQNAEEILQGLELPYRIVTVCTGDMGQGQVFKHDIETWMPGRDAYGETHSCSSFYDFQARRLGIKYRDEQRHKKFAFTLNNTAIASPRILIALLENHQEADGTIKIPKKLQAYLAGREVLEPRRA